MKTIIISAGVVLLVVLLAAGALFYFKGSEILQIGAEKSLLIARSQVEKALPEAYPTDKIMKEFDAVLEKSKTGQINMGELKNLLLWIPAKLEDSNLDSVEVDSLIQRLHRIVVVEQK